MNTTNVNAFKVIVFAVFAVLAVLAEAIREEHPRFSYYLQGASTGIFLTGLAAISAFDK